MNPYNPLLLTYIEYYSEDESDCSLSSKKLSDLSQQEEVDFLSYLLSRNNPKIKEILRANNLFSLEEVKETSKITFTNQDDLLFYCGYGSLERVKQDKKLDDYTIDKIANSSCLITIPTPKNIQDQINARKVKKEQKKKLTEEQKLARKLKKAEKLLKEAGKL